MTSLEQFLLEKLESRKKNGTIRKLKIADSALKDFTSNDYLGLARSKELQKRIDEKIQKSNLRNGATGSRLLSGNSLHHEQLEKQLATVFRAESALLFNSGYAANLGVLSALPSRHDTILYDELCHASIRDGVRLSLAVKHSFRHNDLNDLKHKLEKSSGKVFVAVESIYSMDGDFCPLEEIVKLTEQHNAYLILDEAHSTGTIGEGGAGLAVKLQLQDKIAIRIYTFGKAIGSHGACVAGSRSLTDYLLNFSRPFIYTTALPDHTILSLSETFNFLKENSTLQDALQSKIEVYSESLSKFKAASASAIQTVILGSVETTKRKALHLSANGFDVRPIFSPTVPLGQERLRICLHTYNSDDDILKLTAELNK